ncbi:MAG: uroporphyrinogen-III C-methyltransferase [Coriobacteriales bacterium]|jgi:uroporphyrinogen III methyltransferase/synthase|nr:uroporphyrinogen-III C-methyltransferase [Coriobacteriales bacterium]
MKVTLIGAGPGDKGLLTLRGAECLAIADVVLFDRYVGAEILAMIPETAERIDVGKHAGNHPVPQAEINHLLLAKALEGSNVVRLKGGDPFVFGRGGEELELLVQHNIPFEVVPGITSAIAGPAYSGIPVTHRDYASSLHIITSQAKEHGQPNINFKALVEAGGTLVFLMGVAALNSISDGLLKAGCDPLMPAAIIENATLSTQRSFVGTVQSLPAIAFSHSVVTPALIVVGQVCSLAMSYAWFGHKPLSNRRIIVPRIKPEPSKLAARLRELGAEVDELYYARLIPLPENIQAALDRLPEYRWLVFTSGFGVQVFFSHLIAAGFDVRALAHLKIACVGPETEKEAAKWGIRADFIPLAFSGEALARGLAELGLGQDERLAILRVKAGAEDLTKVLESAGIAFDDIAVYERQTNPLVIADRSYDYAAFASSSAVLGFVEAVRAFDSASADKSSSIDLAKLKAVCIGHKTAATALANGMNVYLSEASTIESLVKRIEELNANGD